MDSTWEEGLTYHYEQSRTSRGLLDGHVIVTHSISCVRSYFESLLAVA